MERVNITAWNTKRNYGPNGQRIAACLLKDGRAAFVDIDRRICATTSVKVEPDRIKIGVMWHYDLGQYREGVYPHYLKAELERAARDCKAEASP